ncbi:hypothetical protein [Rosistilla oblonga]|uniref:hypothetical protein n=1 Tax=Rosistilla oblonga TaxID=2527990 RepID=UPI003A97CA5F
MFMLYLRRSVTKTDQASLTEHANNGLYKWLLVLVFVGNGFGAVHGEKSGRKPG